MDFRDKSQRVHTQPVCIVAARLNTGHNPRGAGPVAKGMVALFVIAEDFR